MKRWHGLLIACSLVLLVFVGAASRSLYLYANADYCQLSSTDSKTCIAQVSGTVVRQISRDIGDHKGPPDILHGVVLDYPGGTCQLWLRPMPPELAPHASVDLLRWNGYCIGIVKEGDTKQYSHYWQPGVMAFFVAWILGTVALLIPLAWPRCRRYATTKAGRTYALPLGIAAFFSVAWVVLLAYTNTQVGLL